jgi:hypothetical protein
VKPKPALLGLAISALSLEPGQRRTHYEMQCFCDAAGEVLGDPKERMSWQRLQQIEGKALRKIRAALYRDKSLLEALQERNHQ